MSDSPVNDWLVDQHRAEYDDVPDLFAECGFATAQALVAGSTGPVARRGPKT